MNWAGQVTRVVGREPVAAQGLTMALVNLLIAFHLVDLTDSQIGAINIFLAAVLAYLVRRSVTPLSNPRDVTGQPLRVASTPPTQATPTAPQ